MYRPSHPGQGPPAPFVPASQQQQRSVGHRSRAIPIVPPSATASPDTKNAYARQAANAVAGTVNGASNATSPSKAALSAKAASAAVFVPKGAPTPGSTASAEHDYDEGSGVPTRMMQEMAVNGPEHGSQQPMQFNPYVGTESGRGTPNSFGGGLGGYDTDGSVSLNGECGCVSWLQADICALRSLCRATFSIRRTWDRFLPHSNRSRTRIHSHQRRGQLSERRHWALLRCERGHQQEVGRITRMSI